MVIDDQRWIRAQTSTQADPVEQLRQSGPIGAMLADRADVRDAAARFEESHGGAPRTGAEVRYDSAERRQQVASTLEAKGVDAETIAAHMAADVAQGRPANDAVKDTNRGAPKARKHRRSGTQQKQRGELSR